MSKHQGRRLHCTGKIFGEKWNCLSNVLFTSFCRPIFYFIVCAKDGIWLRVSPVSKILLQSLVFLCTFVRTSAPRPTFNNRFKDFKPYLYEIILISNNYFQVSSLLTSYTVEEVWSPTNLSSQLLIASKGKVLPRKFQVVNFLARKFKFSI